MPILTEETSLYPETLLEEGLIEVTDRRWWVFYTKPRHEKALARDLLSYGIPFYLPLVPRSLLCRGRVLVARIPLFSGYVFVYGSEAERVRSLTTNRISRTLWVADPETLRWDLLQVHRMIACGAPLTPESRLAPGNRIRVRSGVLAGLEGTVMTRRGRTRLVVCVSFLQQGVSVEIDDFMAESID